jgi:mono/diheme cytochrome c family protein
MTLSMFGRGACAVLSIAVLAACGDPDTPDGRGYTKAPLEKPSVLIAAEEPGEMSRYGSPNRVVAEELQVPDAQTPDASAAAQTAEPVELPEGVTQEMVAAGQTIYSGPGTCFACHGPNGAGTPLAPALNDATWLNVDGSYDALVQVITNGVPQPKQAAVPMMPRGGSSITDAQVREVAAYVYSISRQ